MENSNAELQNLGKESTPCPPSAPAEETKQNVTPEDATTANKTTEKKREQMEIEEKQRENFVTSGNLFIQVFARIVMSYNESNEIGSKYMQKVLHSIFFLGHIYKPAIRPEEYIPANTVRQIMNKFKEPFEQYLTHLPCQTPYSILLEFVTEFKKPQKLEDLMKELWNINKSLWKMDDGQSDQPDAEPVANVQSAQPDAEPVENVQSAEPVANVQSAKPDAEPVANVQSAKPDAEPVANVQSAKPGVEPVANVFTAITVAQSFYKDFDVNQIPKSAYGASLSCQGRIQRRIMIYISCLNVWDRVISYAVCQKGKSPAILFPNHVHCKAYKLICENSEPKEFAPCTNCDKSYPNVKFEPSCNTNADVTWPYGNCAENECLSKLLKDCPNLKNNMCTQKDNQGNQMSIKEIEDTFKKKDEDAMKRDLVNLLGSWKFNLKDRKLLMFQPV